MLKGAGENTKNVRVESPCLKIFKSGALATVASKEFQTGRVRGKKLYLKASDLDEIWLTFFVWFALVRVLAGVR